MVSLNVQDLMPQEAFSLPFPIRRFSVDEYESMARAGILTEDDKVELLEGWIVPKMTKNPIHESVLSGLDESLRSRISTTGHVRVQCAITTPDSEPEPDLVVVRGVPRDYRQRHPETNDIWLVVEVSETSLRRDRLKRRLYARAEIVEYWIVNLEEMCVEIYRDPIGFDDASYQTGVKYFPNDTIETVLPDGTKVTLPVGEFLTPPEESSDGGRLH